MWKSLIRSLEEYGRKKNIQHALLEARVVQKWPEVIARKYKQERPATKVFIKDKILYVWVNEPLWIGELEKNKYFFTQTIEEDTGYALKKIVFLYHYF